MQLVLYFYFLLNEVKKNNHMHAWDYSFISIRKGYMMGTYTLLGDAPMSWIHRLLFFFADNALFLFLLLFDSCRRLISTLKFGPI